jgi:hypothetical protein
MEEEVSRRILLEKSRGQLSLARTQSLLGRYDQNWQRLLQTSLEVLANQLS